MAVLRPVLPFATSVFAVKGQPGADELGEARLRLRKMASYATYAGVIPAPTRFRPYGISALVTARNEEDWVETSIVSVLDFVDEVLAVDHASEDSTPEIMEEMAARFPKKVRLIRFRDEPFHRVLNTLMDTAKYQWICRFSGDFVARTSGPNSIAKLTELLRKLDRHRYFSISLSGIALDGDLHHQFPNRRDHYEPIVFRWSPWLRFGVKERWESLHVPWFYEKLWIEQPYYFHMRSVKSDVRMLQKLYWSYWFDARNKGSPVGLREYMAKRGIQEYGGRTLEEAAKNFTVLEYQGCVPFSNEICGDYPELLVPALADPPFRLVFRDGKVVDRQSGARYHPVTHTEA